MKKIPKLFNTRSKDLDKPNSQYIYQTVMKNCDPYMDITNKILHVLYMQITFISGDLGAENALSIF